MFESKLNVDKLFNKGDHMGINILNTKAKDPTHAIIGVDRDGNTYAVPMSKGPHCLLCGQTGSGKSVMANGILISMIAHSTPDELNIVWVDPKKVEATAYYDLPYCPINPIINMQDAYGMLLYYTWLMDERYEQMADRDVRVKNLPEFNEWVEANPDLAKKKGYEKMKYIIIMIDEYADMKDQIGSEIEDPIKRLGQKARAAGIHMILATQRPSAEVVTPLIRSNVPMRIGMKTVDASNSSLIIQQEGCEKLKLGEAYVMTNDDGLIWVKGPYIKNEEIDRIFAHLREKYPAPEFFDYKQKAVDLGLVEWELPESYKNLEGETFTIKDPSRATSEEIEQWLRECPWENRHVKKKGRSFRF